MTHSNFRGSKGSEHFSIVLLNERSNIMHVNSVISKFSTTTFLCLQRYLMSLPARQGEAEESTSYTVMVFLTESILRCLISEMPRKIFLLVGDAYELMLSSLLHWCTHSVMHLPLFFHSKTHEQESCFYFSSLAFRSIDPLNFIHMQ